MSLFPLIAQMKEDNASAQKTFYYKFSRSMLILCKRYVSIDVVAEDLATDGFIRFFNSLKEFEYVNDKSVIAFLRTTMIHECLNYVNRTKKTYAVEPLEAAEDMVIEETATELLTMQEIFLLVAGLPEDYRIIFCLFEIDGFSHAEIAEQLNIPARLSALKLFRAKKLLQDLILKKYDNDQRRKSI
ncbi:MAG: sigma-70 family RNA polymerase sigma factor [Chitinophagaceae bacterium]